MKKIIFILCMLFPFSVIAEDDTDTHFWVCSQPGYLSKDRTYAVTRVFEHTPNDYDEKEKVFEEYIQKKTEGEFKSSLDSSCRDFSIENRSNKYLKKMLINASKRDYSILWIDFGSLRE